MKGKMSFLWNPAHAFLIRGGVLTLIGRIIERINMFICANDVSAKADIGETTEFKHRGLGCVVHSMAKIGENCVIFQNVTIGSKWSGFICNGEAPVIGDNVMIGAGAVILGEITVGDNSIIGANAVVLNDVPENSIALGVPATIKRRDEVERKSGETARPAD